MRFQVLGGDARVQGRRGRLTTAHGIVETPMFMPVGTLANVKTMTPRDLESVGARMILSNAYHLFLRPGVDVIRRAGGLHAFMRWPGAILTDSGGFQVYSLSKLSEVTDEGVRFQSPYDGSWHAFTPERVMEIQAALGSDVAMVLDQCVASTSETALLRLAQARTLAWAERSLACPRPDGQAVFGISQGGTDIPLRLEGLKVLLELPFDGWALGGLAVGEAPEVMWKVVAAVAPHLPEDKPRYLMGVGSPEDLWEAVEAGVDLFDCVMPTRNARNGTLFTRDGKLNVRAAHCREDLRPVDSACGCYACRTFPRAYLRHLLHCRELLGMHLATLHNLTFMLDLLDLMRRALDSGTFVEAKREFFARYRPQ